MLLTIDAGFISWGLFDPVVALTQFPIFFDSGDLPSVGPDHDIQPETNREDSPPYMLSERAGPIETITSV